MPPERALRFPPIPPDQMTEAQKQMISHYRSSWRKGTLHQGSLGGPLDATLRSPRLAMLFSNVSTYFRAGLTEDGTCLPARLNQLAISIVAREWTSQYAWQVHSKWAIEAGISTQTIEELSRGLRPTRMQPDEEIVYDFLIELQRERRVNDKTFQKARLMLGERVLIDLIGVAGYYTLVVMELAAIDAPPLDPTLPLLKPVDTATRC